VLLWLAIIWTIKSFFAISKPAAVLLIPYIVWVSFALVLNVAFLTLN
jgi:tryptophan-rich sensory protein